MNLKDTFSGAENYFPPRIGSSSDVTARLKFHNAGLQRSTRSRIPFKLVLSGVYSAKEESLKRGKQTELF